ncbi:MAG: YidC/Oxa1 family insertase periplasmic-domain containing protein [Verrucomicrobia bacterium]|nr:YidC/Oxa1 family insertase periplasmic-domain containing protein [Verrucomicrobiota bacterium]
MDKKNFTIGALLLVAAFALLFFGPRPAPQAPVPEAPAPKAAPGEPAGTAGSTTTAASPATPAAAATPPNTMLANVHRDAADARVVKLENDYISARFTDFGGAVRDVAFKKYAAVLDHPDPYVFNLLHEDPLLAFTDYPGLGRTTRYELVSSSATEVVFRHVLDGKVEVTRRYRLTREEEKGGDPYRIHHETTFRNLGGSTLPLGKASLSVGTAGLMDAADVGQYLNIVSSNGSDTQFIERSELEGGGIGSIVGAGRQAVPLLEKPGNVAWAGAKNQFFTSIYTPDKPAVGVAARRIELPPFPNSQHPNIGMSGAARFDLPVLAPNASASLTGLLYVGPQEYRRLARFQANEDRVLPYTQYFFNRIFLSGYVAPLQNILLNMTHNWVGNWGVAVILMTLILKVVSLPFTIAASRSAKKMAKLQPELQVIREKYKDNPQKQQQATMELFKAKKINPLGGCIPILITFPLFIGFFAMLQCTAELRLQPFLWARDLAAPDTVGHLFGIPWLPINIMPILMGATMVIQMRLTPTPSVDNVQMKMMKFMPYIFTLFCYGFSCALALYSTINGLFTIGQQLVINRMKDPEETVPATASGPAGRPVKNVTPGKKHK